MFGFEEFRYTTAGDDPPLLMPGLVDKVLPRGKMDRCPELVDEVIVDDGLWLRAETDTSLGIRGWYSAGPKLPRDGLMGFRRGRAWEELEAACT